MTRFLSLAVVAVMASSLSAQNFKVVKVGNPVPLIAKSGRPVGVGQLIGGVGAVKWPSKDSWLKVYNVQNRRITYFGPRGVSAKGKAFVTGNSDLSCRVTFDDSDSPVNRISSSFNLSIPDEFRIRNGAITPSLIKFGRDVELKSGDYICASYNSQGKQIFQKLFPMKDASGQLSVTLDASTFSIKPLYSDRWNGCYVNFYLVHHNNYILLKDKCVVWTIK